MLLQKHLVTKTCSCEFACRPFNSLPHLPHCPRAFPYNLISYPDYPTGVYRTWVYSCLGFLELLSCIGITIILKQHNKLNKKRKKQDHVIRFTDALLTESFNQDFQGCECCHLFTQLLHVTEKLQKVH